MSKFVTIQVGQCGNQIGNSFWPLVLREHGIPTNVGGVNLLKTQKNYKKNTKELSEAFDSFFHIPKSRTELAFQSLPDLVTAKVKARAVLIDMEDRVISRYKCGQLKSLFDQSCMISNNPGSGNNWATGYYTHGSKYCPKIEEMVRHTVEKCDSLHGFLLLHSLGGGTGSGLGAATLEILHDNYPQIDRHVTCVYPMGSKDVITAPYNSLLTTRKLLEHATCVFPVENSVLQEICNPTLNKKGNTSQLIYNASCKPFQDMNSVIVNMLLHLTSGARFPGPLNTDMNEFSTNLVPYPSLHYISCSVSPSALTTPDVATYCTSKFYDELFTKAWSRNNQMTKVDPLKLGSVCIGAAHIVRGNFSLSDVERNIQRFQKKAKLTPWNQNSTKIGICSVPPSGYPASVLSLLNSTSMSDLFSNVQNQFEKLYKTKAYVHHYTQVENFDIEEFHESKEIVASVSTRYKELQNQTPIVMPRLSLV